MAGGMISVTGHTVKDHGPHCALCQSRIVRFHGATCSACRLEDIRDRKAFGAIVLIVICAALLIMGFASAYGEWVRLNG